MIDPAALETLKRASTGMINDALTMSGIQGTVVGIGPARGFEDTKIVGPASTLFLAPVHPDAPKQNMYAAIRKVPAGAVLVVDGGGWQANFTGDNQADCAKRVGVAGVVVNGAARDVAGFRAIGMPVFHNGTSPRVGNVQLTAVDVPVEVGGVQIRPGDIILADEDGVVSIPAGMLDTVLANLKTIFQVEAEMEAALQREAPWEELAAILSKKHPKK